MPATNILCSKLIGRDTYVEQFVRILSGAAGGRGTAVAISGEAGIGKSRLTAELRRLATEFEPGFDAATGSCFEFDTSTPYAPIIDMLRACMQAKTPEQIRECAGADGQDLLRILPELGEALPGVTPALQDSDQGKRQLFNAMSNVLLRLSSSNPLLVVLEDVHWSDDASMEFLQQFARKISSSNLVVVLNFRADEVQPSLRRLLGLLERERAMVEWPLSRLSAHEVQDMLATIFELTTPPSRETATHLLGLTEGNPFFIEEVLKSLVSSGELSVRGGGIERVSVSDVPIPRSVQAAVQERTASLTARARQIVELAAISGRRFDFRLLGHLSGFDENDLLDVIKELISAQLVSEETADHFVFRHALTQQAIYSELLARERRSIHTRIGEAIQSIYADSIDNHLMELAYHFFLAEQWDEAYFFCRRAGERALSLNAPQSANDLLSRALQAAERLGVTAPAPVHRMRGKALESLGEFERARADYERSLEIAHGGSDGPAEWQALIDLGFLWAGREYERSGTYFQQARDLAERLDDDELRAKSLNRLGNWLVNVGRGEEAIPLHEQALGIVEGLNDQPARAATLDLLGMAQGLYGNQPEALRRYRESVPLFRQLGDKQGIATALAGAAAWYSPQLSEATHVTAFDEREALAVAHEAVSASQAVASLPAEMFAHMSAGQIHIDCGRYVEAREHARTVLRLAEETSHQQWLSAGEWETGVVSFYTFDFGTAVEQLSRALEIAQRLGSAWWLGNASAYLARARLALGDNTGARAALSCALAEDGEPTSLGLRRVALVWGELFLAEGQPERALAGIDQLQATSPGAAPDAHMPVLRRIRGEILTAMGRRDDARDELTRARDDALAAGTPTVQWPIERALASVFTLLKDQPSADGHTELARGLIARIGELNADDADLRERFETGALATLPHRRAATANQEAKARYGGLTGREREVATLIAQGKSNRDIADTLVLGERTIETHVGNILSKLGFSSRAQVAAWAVEVGLTRTTT